MDIKPIGSIDDLVEHVYRPDDDPPLVSYPDPPAPLGPSPPFQPLKLKDPAITPDIQHDQLLAEKRMLQRCLAAIIKTTRGPLVVPVDAMMAVGTMEPAINVDHDKLTQMVTISIR